jgi:hypothetical protein
MLAATLAASVLPALPAHADDPAPPGAPSATEEARRRFQRGVQFYKDGDLRSALVEFREANRLAPNYRVDYNIGQTCEELQDFAGATLAFRSYLEQGGAAIPDARRKAVDDDLRSLAKHVARLDVTASEAGAALVAEGERHLALGASPLAGPVLLNAGTWDVTATKDGFRPAAEHVTVAGGDARRVTLTLARAEAPAPVIVEVARPVPAVAQGAASVAPARSMAPVWVGVGVTGALAIGAGITGGLALAANSDYRTKLGTLGTTSGDVAAATNRAHAFALASDLQTGAAVAAALGTTILYLTRRPASHAGAPAVTGVSLDVLVAPTFAGVRGAF